MRTLDPAKMEVILVGDFDPKEAEMHFASYFGAIRGVGVINPPRTIPDVRLSSNEDVTKLSVYDQENRAVVGFTGHVRGRWSMTDLDLQTLRTSYTPPKHADKAFGSRCLTVLSEIINNRLYKEIREGQKLTYWVSFGLSYLDTQDFSIVSIRMSPLADRVEEAIGAVKRTLRNIVEGEITEEEFNQAVSPMIAQCESNLKLNSYWVSLLSNVTSSYCVKDSSCIVKIREAYSSLTLEDVKAYGCSQLRGMPMQVTLGETRSYRNVQDILPDAPAVLRDLPLRTLPIIATGLALAIGATTILVRNWRKVREH